LRLYTGQLLSYIVRPAHVGHRLIPLTVLLGSYDAVTRTSVLEQYCMLGAHGPCAQPHNGIRSSE